MQNPKTHSPQESLTDLKKMFSQIEQIFSHITRTRFAAFFMLMLALPIAARAQEVTIKSSPTSIMEGNRATFIISVTPAPTRNLRVNIKVTSGGPVLPNNYTPPTTITIGTSGQATLTVPTVDFTEVPPPAPPRKTRTLRRMQTGARCT